MKEGGQARSLRQKVLSERRWLSSEGTVQVERGRTWADGWGCRRTVSSCAPGGWKTRWRKTIEMGGKMDEGMDGEWSSWTESGLTFLSEECVPVRSLGQTERGGCRWLKLLLIALLHPSRANWKQGRGYCKRRGCQQGGRESFLRWSINTVALHRDNPKAPFHLLIRSPAKPCGLLRSLSRSLSHLHFTSSFQYFCFSPQQPDHIIPPYLTSWRKSKSFFSFTVFISSEISVVIIIIILHTNQCWKEHLIKYCTNVTF